jgi:hypothetical protein
MSLPGWCEPDRTARVVQVTEGQAVSRYQDPYRAELADRNARQLGASNASVL